MFKKYKNNPIIKPNSKIPYEKECTYNPCTIKHKNKIYMIYRAEGKYGDYISHLCLAKSEDGFNFKKYKNNPIIKPEYGYEKRGCEDPRITQINDTFYLTYTAFRTSKKSKNKIGLALATSKNLINWEKHGIILKNIKSGYILPEKIKNKYIMLVGDENIYIATSKDLIKWKLNKNPLMSPRKNHFDSKLVEVGPPTIIIKDKILLFYNSANEWNEYNVGYVIFNKNFTKILYRTTTPTLTTTEQFELYGKVNNVIFAQGLIEHNNKYFLYYGGGDKCIGVATTNQKEIKRILR